MAETPISDKELERRLREMSEAEVAKLPEPPSLDESTVVMEDQDPEKFAAMLRETAGGEATGGATSATDKGDPLERIVQLLKNLPDKIASALGVE